MSRRGSRSPNNAECGHFTLLFYQEWADTGLELACNMRRNIIKKKYISFAFDKTHYNISTSCKQISVQNMEYQYDLL